MGLFGLCRISVQAVFVLAAVLVSAGHTLAQDGQLSSPIARETADVEDQAIAERLSGIFSEISSLDSISVSVRRGVVILEGEVASEAAAERAADIASRVTGVVTVEDQLQRTLDIESNVSPFVGESAAVLNRLVRSWPVYLIALAAFVTVIFLGFMLASWSVLWSRLAPSPFLASMMAQGVRIASIALAILIAFGLLGATAVLGALAGAVGIIGLALGFAVRDTIENYIASILLSVRQPFRASEHVVINEHEGTVVRLTSRATVLMTLDGNHLRIPNADVFKGIILNYSRNPERRFEFDLGVDAEDDPVAAMDTGLRAIAKLDFVLAETEPDAAIVEVGDSSIIVRFNAWIDQSVTDYLKARSLAIRAAKTVIEEEGFTLPEPIYRLRFDQPFPADPPSRSQPDAPTASPPSRKPKRRSEVHEAAADDVRPDRHLARKVADERAEADGEDLLSSANPVE
ncbi:mechanosensitive ion channel family protein [Hyphobacterium sp.]|uniref:mechanosensitive ion channel family protein n=1 Tax=Hyphobacterium sp. TaxID=2004662 RepID=UPI003B523F06